MSDKNPFETTIKHVISIFTFFAGAPFFHAKYFAYASSILSHGIILSAYYDRFIPVLQLYYGIKFSSAAPIYSIKDY